MDTTIEIKRKKSFIRKTSQRKFFGFSISFFLLLATIIGSYDKGLIANAADAVQTNSDKKILLQERLQQLNSQIRSYQTQIGQVRKQSASLANEIKIYDNNIASTELQIQANQTRMEDTTLQIEELEVQIERRQKEIADNKKILAELIVQLHQLDGNSILHMGLGNENFSDFLDQLQYTESVQSKVFQLLQHIKEIKTKLEAKTKELQGELELMKELQKQLDDTQNALQSQRTGKEQLLSQTKNSEKNYQKLLTVTTNEQADLQKEMDDLDAGVRAKLGRRSISGSKGLLDWPMDGVITQGYGNTGFKALGYSFHNGIDIAAAAGAPIYAAADGTITACGSGQAAYGNWCVLRSTLTTKSGNRDIVTLYAHMRSIKARSGQKLAKGDVIGYEGNTGNTTRLLYGPDRGYHLHFVVFDAEGFGISPGKSTKIYGPYSVPYGYTYNPMEFL
jgi:murein DD-endopeptidase MepM/ murein hydrolase activator NlpD